ncbi:MAG: membrane dipeptidase [Sphingomonas sp.]
MSRSLKKLTILAGLLLAARRARNRPATTPARRDPRPRADARQPCRRAASLDSQALFPARRRISRRPRTSDRGGVDAVVLAVAVGPGPRDAAGTAAARQEADAKLAWIKAFAASNPDRVGLALAADDVERLHREGKVAVIIGFQNTRSIGSDLSQLDAFYQAGGARCSRSTMPGTMLSPIRRGPGTSPRASTAAFPHSAARA